MAKDPRVLKAAGPLMPHTDLHKRNIFVSDDPTIITAIIDWQSCSIEPAFWYADKIPDFAQPVPNPSNEDEIESKSEACAKAYNISTQFRTPKLSGPRSMDEAFFRPFRYCYRTWADDAVAFREELIQTSRRWKELGFPGSCPFPSPSFDEFGVHRKYYKRFEAVQRLKNDMANLLNVPTEDWEITEEAHREAFEEMVKFILANENPEDDEPIWDEADAREIWPFDLEDGVSN